MTKNAEHQPIFEAGVALHTKLAGAVIHKNQMNKNAMIKQVAKNLADGLPGFVRKEGPAPYLAGAVKEAPVKTPRAPRKTKVKPPREEITLESAQAKINASGTGPKTKTNPADNGGEIKKNKRPLQIAAIAGGTGMATGWAVSSPNN